MKTENKFFIYDRPVIFDWKFPLKLVRKFGRICFYHINYLLTPKKKVTEKKYNVSIVAIFKNEGKYLKEWIEFNRLVGIEHFYLYNNNSEDNYTDVLATYLKEGLVTLIDWPKNHAQMECYRDAILKFSNESKWIGFIDIDEFIVPNSVSNIYDFLRTKENQPSVNIYWKMFCSSGLIDRDPDSLVTETFFLAYRKYVDIGKCFYNTAFDFYDDITGCNLILHHHFYAKGILGKLAPMNLFGKICVEDSSNPVSIGTNPEVFPIQINHYFSKTYNEYLEKASKGDVFFEQNPHNLDYFYNADFKCSSPDYSAFKYLVKLKKEMGKK